MNARNNFFLLLLLCGIFCVTAVPVKSEKEAPPKKESFDEILEANKDIEGSMFEGDILMPKQRNAIQNKTLRWNPMSIPYEIQEGIFAFEAINKMHVAMAEYSARTCLSFVARTNQENYIRFMKGSGCYSGVGMNGGRHDVSIGGGCDGHGVIIHELMHALGFWHEQSRTDRDEYVQISWDNVQPGKEFNFDKYDSSKVDLLDEVYDYGSIMHYSSTAFSKNGNRTIIGLQEGSEAMGQRNGFSRLDLIKMNKLYECGDVTDASGYTQWTEWSPCDINCVSERKRFCDSDNCQIWGEEDIQESGCHDCVAGLDPDCGQQILTGVSGTVSSPLFPYEYKANSICTQTIEVPDGFRIKLVFELMDIEDYAGGCYYDFLHIYDGETSDSTELITLCSTAVPSPVYSSGNHMTIVFKSDVSIVKKGYFARYYVTNAPVIQCAFEDENDYCGWTNDVTGELTFQWISGKTPSADTGPNADHTFATEHGHYLFLESSAPAANGNKARIISPEVTSMESKFCLTLWYNMYGDNIGTINVYVMKDSTLPATPVFSVSGDKFTANWYEAKVTIDSAEVFQIVIEGQRYNGFRGDLAVDDVRLDEGRCP